MGRCANSPWFNYLPGVDRDDYSCRFDRCQDLRRTRRVVVSVRVSDSGTSISVIHTGGICTAISLPLAFGEEFGWRGYAQAKLVRAFGLVSGLLLLGVIWGFWHTPIYYFMGAYPNHHILGPFVDSDRQYSGGDSHGLVVHPIAKHLGTDVHARFRGCAVGIFRVDVSCDTGDPELGAAAGRAGDRVGGAADRFEVERRRSERNVGAAAGGCCVRREQPAVS
jgi:hypothetical protein